MRGITISLWSQGINTVKYLRQAQASEYIRSQRIIRYAQVKKYSCETKRKKGEDEKGQNGQHLHWLLPVESSKQTSDRRPR